MKTARDKPEGLYLRGTVWWTKIRGFRESTGTSDLKEATRILNVRKGKAAQGRAILPRVDTVKFPEAKQDLLAWYETYNKRNITEAARRFKHIDPFFQKRRLVEVAPAIPAFVAKRRKDGAADGTIYVEIATIRKLLTVAYENNKLERRPIIHNVSPDNVRQGFFEREPFERVRRYLTPDIQVAVTIQYLYGWRTKKEVMTLEWRQIDWEAETIRLEAGTTKNKEGRYVYMTPELKEMFLAQHERVRRVERETGQVIPYVFCHLGGEKWTGKRITEFRKQWKNACQQAGVPGMIPHDLRRTAVRNMDRRGVPRPVGMKVTGHKTEKMYRRYNIGDDGDLREVRDKLSGTIEGTRRTEAELKA